MQIRYRGELGRGRILHAPQQHVNRQRTSMKPITPNVTPMMVPTVLSVELELEDSARATVGVYDVVSSGVVKGEVRKVRVKGEVPLDIVGAYSV
ncbi:hypothetical protein TWF694_006806 [Orbilia ellipsospora]|uniref:Uncharacterized protein n=1 Tax=Orbilia ellipsospora TaxID=2528407 RepID=A0AAV9XL95_9PEZI